MKSPDSGNQRTGQPRCAQLIANTWNASPVDSPHPARHVRRLPVPRLYEGVPVGREPRLAFGKIREPAERDPRLLGQTACRREQEADHRNREQRRGGRVQREAEREQEPASRDGGDEWMRFARISHRCAFRSDTADRDTPAAARSARRPRLRSPARSWADDFGLRASPACRAQGVRPGARCGAPDR